MWAECCSVKQLILLFWVIIIAVATSQPLLLLIAHIFIYIYVHLGMQFYRKIQPDQAPMVTVNLPSIFYDVMMKKPLSLECSVQTNISHPIVLVPQVEDGETVLVSESPVQVVTALDWFPNQANFTDSAFGRFFGHTLSHDTSFYNKFLSKIIFSMHESKYNMFSASEKANHGLQ